MIVAGLLLVAGLIHYVTGFGNSPPQHQRNPPVTASNRPSKHYGFMGLEIAFGSTRKQVQHQIGSPTKEQAHCWLYRGHVGEIRGRYSGPGVDAMKFCFSEGPAGGNVMTQIFSHYAAHTNTAKDPVTQEIKTKHYPASWDTPITLMKVPDWYLKTNF